MELLLGVAKPGRTDICSDKSVSKALTEMLRFYREMEQRQGLVVSMAGDLHSW